VNKYKEDTDMTKVKVLSISKASVLEQISSLKKFRRSRDQKKVESSLDRLKTEASNTASERKNLMPFIIEATKLHATTGEISKALREAYGEYHPRSSF
jgi:methylmalonyl-CoA mutase, N-terminal domain